MYRAPRSTRTPRMFVDANRPVDRSPVIFAAAASIIVLTAFACAVHDDKKEGDTTVAAASSPTTTQPTVGGEVTDPGHAVPQNVTFASAESAYTKRRYLEAVESFDVYVQRHPKNAFGHYMLGLSAWKSGDLDRASAAFERSLELDPRNVKTLLNHGRVLLEQGRPDDALVRVGAAIEIDSRIGRIHRMVGRVQTARGQRDSATTSYRVRAHDRPRGQLVHEQPWPAAHRAGSLRGSAAAVGEGGRAPSRSAGVRRTTSVSRSSAPATSRPPPTPIAPRSSRTAVTPRRRVVWRASRARATTRRRRWWT